MSLTSPLDAHAWEIYHNTIEEAKAVLGKRRFALITPALSVPTTQNTGVGSLLGAKNFFEFVRRIGFDTIQDLPVGQTRLGDPSPYTGDALSMNVLRLDLWSLAYDPQWQGLLSQGVYQLIVDQMADRDPNRIDHIVVGQLYEQAFEDIIPRFKALIDSNTPAAQVMTVLYRNFVAENSWWLEPYAIYEALSTVYSNDYWPNWQGPDAEIDRNLYSPADDTVRRASEGRIAMLKYMHRDIIERYEVLQFLVHAQHDAFKQYAKSIGLAVMGDRQVGFSNKDIWLNQRLFMKTFKLGVPPDLFTDEGQAWGFPVISPELMFNEDGSLGEGGLFLKRIFQKILRDFPDGFRLDHTVGLIDPWVYPANENHTKNGARLHSSPTHETLWQYRFIGENDVNPAEYTPDHEYYVKGECLGDLQVDAYSRIIERVVLDVARENGLSQDSIIFEDLGTLTNPVVEVMDRHQLSGIRVTQFSSPDLNPDPQRAIAVHARHWVAIGTHDNVSLLEWANGITREPDNEFNIRLLRNLAGDIIPEGRDIEELMHQIRHYASELSQAKFTELFLSPAQNTLVFFTDLLGLEATYNRPGTYGPENWTLRIPQDYEATYFTHLGQGRGLNLPLALAKAIEARGDDFLIQHTDLRDRLLTVAEQVKKTPSILINA